MNPVLDNVNCLFREGTEERVEYSVDGHVWGSFAFAFTSTSSSCSYISQVDDGYQAGRQV